MWKLLICLAIALAACGDDDSADSPAGAPDWLTSLTDAEVERQDVNGREVWVDEDGRTIYVKGDCDTAEEELAVEGAPFGPSDGEAGYATICAN